MNDPSVTLTTRLGHLGVNDTRINMTHQPALSVIISAISAVILIPSCKEKEKVNAMEPAPSSGLGLPVIADISPDVPQGAEVMLHVIVTTSENPFALEPILKVLSKTAKTRKAAIGEGGTFSDVDLADIVKSLGVTGIVEMRLQSIQATGPAEGMLSGSSVTISPEDGGDTYDLDERVVADAEGKLHAFVVVQVAEP